MNITRKLIISVGVAGAIALAGAGVAVAAAGGDDNEPPITGPALERASAVALDFTGGGQVTDTEVGDEDSYYEVEVTLADGTEIDVQLNEDFELVGGAPDTGPDDE